MDPLPLSAKLFAGCIVHIAVYGAATSDSVTKPIAGSALWKELLAVSSAVHKPTEVGEVYDVPDADTGWREEEDVFTVGDVFELKARYTTALFEQLRYGLAGAIVQGTPQTPFVKGDRKIQAWVNLQRRMQDGTDRNVAALWCDLRAMEPPADEKKTQEPVLKLRVLKSTLNSVNWPA